jgi:hypothetical protein
MPLVVWMEVTLLALVPQRSEPWHVIAKGLPLQTVLLDVIFITTSHISPLVGRDQLAIQQCSLIPV